MENTNIDVTSEDRIINPIEWEFDAVAIKIIMKIIDSVLKEQEVKNE